LVQDRTSDDPSSAGSLEGRVKGSTRGTEFIDRYSRARLALEWTPEL
jgi:hypothetical protein